jgi:hypothetical protein
VKISSIDASPKSHGDAIDQDRAEDILENPKAIVENGR